MQDELERSVYLADDLVAAQLRDLVGAEWMTEYKAFIAQESAAG